MVSPLSILRRFNAWRRTRHRAIFRYWDGARWRYGDPFVLWRGIVNHAEFNIETMPELVDTGQEPETSICLKAIDEVFGVHAIDDATGAGLTAWERLDLLASLSDYLEALKKNIGAMPTLPALTDSKFFRSSDQQGAAATDTSGSLDSGSMLSEPKPDSPTALSEESSPESAAS